MRILVFNAGSSSLGYKLYETSGRRRVVRRGKAHRVAVQGDEPSFIEHVSGDGQSSRDVINLPDHRTAAHLILKLLEQCNEPIDAIGHRFVHGGEYFDRTVRVDDTTLPKLQACAPMAPIHSPAALSIIDECRSQRPNTPSFVVFDTAFHAHLPVQAREYAIPKRLRQLGYRKYGFHGLSYQSVMLALRQYLPEDVSDKRLIVCHLGTGGSSVAAIHHGRSVDTTMGYSPLPGLVMSTRCGDLDPSVVADLVQRQGMTLAEVMSILNHQSGLLGVSGCSSDVRDIIKRRDRGDERAALAFDMLIHRLRLYLGGYMAVLGGLDVLAFTDDVGLRVWQVRQAACENMQWAGLQLDEQRNRSASPDVIAELQVPGARVRILVVPNDEESMICAEGEALLAGIQAGPRAYPSGCVEAV